MNKRETPRELLLGAIESYMRAVNQPWIDRAKVCSLVIEALDQFELHIRDDERAKVEAEWKDRKVEGSSGGYVCDTVSYGDHKEMRCRLIEGPFPSDGRTKWMLDATLYRDQKPTN